MARKFFFICAGLLCLALAYHFGATSATAQAPANPVVTSFFNGSAGGGVVVTADGDVYVTPVATNYGNWVLTGNVFAGGPTPAKAESFGSVKVRYR